MYNTIFEPMQKQVLHQFSIRLTCPLLNIVSINLKIQRDIPFSDISLYLLLLLLLLFKNLYTR